jgi:hypothetical protein
VTTQAEQSGSHEDDDPGISGDEMLYRRLSFNGGAWVVENPVTHERRPSSGGFSHDTDGVSVFRRSLLLAHDPPLSPSDVGMTPGDIIVGFSVSDVRSLQLGVRNDLWPKDVIDPDHPRYCAHALIVGLDELGKSGRIKKQKKLADALSMTFVNG